MKKVTLEVKGMSCNHCENRVNTSVGALNGVKKVVANAKKGNVIVKFDEDIVELAKIKQTITEEGYKI